MAPELEEGWVAHELAREFPELRLVTLTVACTPGRSSAGVRVRLQMASSKLTGARAIALRVQPVPSAYRVFYRLIGLDPDRDRTPVEEAALQRLIRGDYEARDLVRDALTLALVETGVPVLALDAAHVEGPLGLRTALRGERLGSGPYANDLPPGRLVVADAAGPRAVLFGAVEPACEPGPSTRSLRLAAVGVAGVPDIHVEEALWACVEALA